MPAISIDMMQERRPRDLCVGVSGGASDAAIAVADEHGVLGVVAQERLTRVRGAGLPPRGPRPAVDLLLRQAGHPDLQVARWIVTPSAVPGLDGDVRTVDGHRAAAATAFLSSPYQDALVLVCDRDAPKVSAWLGDGATLEPLAIPWRGEGFADLLSRCASWLGLTGEGAHARFEALARLAPDVTEPSLDGLIRLGEHALLVDDGLEPTVQRLLASAGPDIQGRASVASALARGIGRALLEWAGRLQQSTATTRVTLGGELFYQSSFNTMIAMSGVFDEVFVPVDPGDAGRAVGAVLLGLGRRVAPVAPFLGPDYTAGDIKAVLDNCKLQYSWESEDNVVSLAVKALAEGRLVGWFEGPMEWGRRALGGRSILAHPLAPYALENLNRFLKRREPWRGYAMSGSVAAVSEHFTGPAASPFMQFEYRARPGSGFDRALPHSQAATRLHTVDGASPPRFTYLLTRFAEVTGCPFLFNTSFNGFHEPIVCDPRDAVRVFYGTGLDLLVLGQFIIRK